MEKKINDIHVCLFDKVQYLTISLEHNKKQLNNFLSLPF
jgi:hypothetical protein